MPLRVTVDLMRDGYARERLGEIYIANVGGSMRSGDYVVKVIEGVKSKKTLGKVFGHPRLAEPVWSLVVKAIESLGFLDVKAAPKK